MANPSLERLSKFLSFVLRHKPESIGLTLDRNGWGSIDDLISKSNEHGVALSRDDLLAVVDTSDKKRFSLSEEGTRIRAAQGHSVSVDLALSPKQPPASLYHGTATRFVERIMVEGLMPGERQHVHLSSDADTARHVGKRHGRPVVLRVNALGMGTLGHRFYLAENGVWLTDHVPPEFLELLDPDSSAADSAATSRQPKPSRKIMK
jgi:putative RNA 2'-phosphotransferase